MKPRQHLHQLFHSSNPVVPNISPSFRWRDSCCTRWSIQEDVACASARSRPAAGHAYFGTSESIYSKTSRWIRKMETTLTNPTTHDIRLHMHGPLFTRGVRIHTIEHRASYLMCPRLRRCSDVYLLLIYALQKSEFLMVYSPEILSMFYGVVKPLTSELPRVARTGPYAVRKGVGKRRARSSKYLSRPTSV